MRAALALIATTTLWLAAVCATSSASAAGTVIIVPPTGMANPADYPEAMTNARDYYLGDTACSATATCTEVQIAYPASFWPLAFLKGWCAADCQKWDVSVQDGVDQLLPQIDHALSTTDDPVVLFGHSQGSAVISNALNTLAALSDADKARLTIILTGGIDNPNGGLWSRLGFLGHVPIVDVTTGLPTPTDTGINFTSIIMEYDGVGDSPKYWGNLLALANSIAGFAYLHGTTLAPDENTSTTTVPDYYPSVDAYLAAVNDPANARTDSYGNTYIVVPTPTLPILMPLLDIAKLTNTSALVQPIVNLISPVLRVLIDLGYDRTSDPGTYTPLSILPFSLHTDPVKVLGDLAQAVVQGVHDAINGVPGQSVSPQPSQTGKIPAKSDPGADVTPVTSADKPSPASSRSSSSAPLAEHAAPTTSLSTAGVTGDGVDHPEAQRRHATATADAGKTGSNPVGSHARRTTRSNAA